MFKWVRYKNDNLRLIISIPLSRGKHMCLEKKTTMHHVYGSMVKFCFIIIRMGKNIILPSKDFRARLSSIKV